jgi:transposase
VAVIFYDLTTLYFETESEDDLRKIGFSKDAQWQKPQVMLGLLVAVNGYPIGYDVFAGNTFEGHTLIPAIKRLEKKFSLNKPVIVADAALLNKTNLDKLAASGYDYILGARIRNEPKVVKDQILAFSLNGLNDQPITQIKKGDQTRLIIGYSAKRAKKDAYNRKRGLKRLERNLHSGKLTKAQINNRGYNKYLRLTGKVRVEIDYQKFRTDGQWDGLKGYVTNSSLSAKQVIDNYTQLWQIEKAFRISKTDLKVRPIYHRLEKRIKAHICVAFTAYAVYKELERLLYQHQVPFSSKRASELTQTMYQITYTLPESLKEEKQLFKMSEEQETLVKIVHKKV